MLEAARHGNTGAPAGRPVSAAPVEPAVFDPSRLAAVHATGLLDAAASESFDALTQLASTVLGTPMAFLTLVDDRRSFWLSSTGVDGARQNPVEESFCQYVIADRAPLAVDDATADARVADNPSVALLGVRAWAGCPVMDLDGHALGSFCVMDTRAHTWTEADTEVLQVLAAAASAQISLVRAVVAERQAQDEARVLREGQALVQRRLEQLSGVTSVLVAATDLDGLTEIIIDQALPVLGVDGGAVVLCEAGGMRVAVSQRLGDHVQLTYGHLPTDSPLPGCHVARTGERLALPDRAAGVAFHPDMEQVYAHTRRHAWAFVPLRLRGEVLGALAASWVDERTSIPDDELDLLDAFAAQCAIALDRIRSAEVERAATAHVEQLAAALQRSLLTRPPAPHTLDIAARYLPAVTSAQVGGDWHDAFDNGLGSMLVSVGDVAGHEGNSAAAMAQIRNLLRGLAIDSDDSPAVLLARLDRAMAQFGLDTLASAVLARIDRSPVDLRRGLVRLRWSSAGHLPPLLRQPDGEVRVLASDSDPMLGISAELDRVERVTEMPLDSTLLLYTDGLVERRGESISDGIERLTRALREHGAADLEQLCDLLLADLLPDPSDDDVAVLVLRPLRSSAGDC